jgi:hypothetical protein
MAMVVTRHFPAKERLRFPVNCAVITKSTPSLDLVIVLLDLPHDFCWKRQDFYCFRETCRLQDKKGS